MIRMTRLIRSTFTTSIVLALVAMAAVQARSTTGQGEATNGFKPYTQDAFDAAAKAGKTTLVFFHAPWCPVCTAQEPKVLAHLNGDARQVVAFKVDYDTNKALRQEMHVTKQSTLILYRGTQELGRLSYKSDDASIDELFAHASMPTMSGKQ